MTNQRPTGVTILAVLQIIGGLLKLLFGIGGLFYATDAANANIGLVTGFGTVFIISGIIGLIAGYGLFTLKGWGWVLAIVFSLLSIVSDVISIFQRANIVGSIVAIVISGLIIYYLYRPNIKRAFGKV